MPWIRIWIQIWIRICTLLVLTMHFPHLHSFYRGTNQNKMNNSCWVAWVMLAFLASSDKDFFKEWVALSLAKCPSQDPMLSDTYFRPIILTCKTFDWLGHIQTYQVSSQSSWIYNPVLTYNNIWKHPNWFFRNVGEIWWFTLLTKG